MEGQVDLWQQFFKHRSIEIRNELIINYAPLIKYCAQRVYHSLPKNIDFDDLLSYGSFGLLDAVNKFNPDYNANFQAYAMLRIRGAILDGLRKMDWASQSMRRKAKELEKTYTILGQKLGRSPSDAEVADALGITENELNKQLTEVGHLSIISLEQPIEDDENNLLTLGDKLIDNKSPNPAEFVEKNELKAALSQAIQELNEKEKLVITLYYFEELAVKEISKILELSEGRISQIHKKAVLKLKGKLS